MVYLDTSFVAPLVIAEDTSDAVEAIVLKLKAGELTNQHVDAGRTGQLGGAQGSDGRSPGLGSSKWYTASSSVC